MQLDTRIPMMAVGEALNPAGIMQQAAQFRQKQQAADIAQRLDELKLDYENRKKKRESDTERYMGEELSAITAAPTVDRTEYVWQQPRTVTEPTGPARQPTAEEMQNAAINAMFRAGDRQGAFDAMKAARAGQVSQAKPYSGDTKIGPDGQAYALNLLTARYEPTGFFPERPVKEAPLVKVETNEGTKFVRPKEGMTFKPPEKEAKPDVTPYQRIQLEGQLRDDYRTDSKNYAEIKRQSTIIKSAINDPSAAGTLSAATAYMKMLDPGSVVRESELGMAMNTQGSIDRLKSYWTTIEMGKVLTPQQKADFARLSDQYLRAAEEAQRNLNKRYSDIATGYGLDAKRVVMYDVDEKQRQQNQPRNIKTASDWLKSRAIKTQQQFSAEVAKLKKSGWTDDEIRQAARDAGL